METNYNWIKLHRKILDWEYYNDLPTKCLFIHLLLKANYIENEFKGMIIKAGQRWTSVKSLSYETGLTDKQVRTALSKLQKGKQIEIETANNGTRITICKYEDYQINENQKGKQRANETSDEGQQYKKDIKEKKKDIAPEIFELIDQFHNFKLKDVPELMKSVSSEHKNSSAEIDKLMRIDGFTLTEIKDVLRWSLRDKFWRLQILSLSSLRNKGKNGETKFVNCRTAYLRDRKEPAQQQKISRDPTVPEAIWGHYNAEQLEEYHKKLNEYFGKTNK